MKPNYFKTKDTKMMTELKIRQMVTEMVEEALLLGLGDITRSDVAGRNFTTPNTAAQWDVPEQGGGDSTISKRTTYGIVTITDDSNEFKKLTRGTLVSPRDMARLHGMKEGYAFCRIQTDEGIYIGHFHVQNAKKTMRLYDSNDRQVEMIPGVGMNRLAADIERMIAVNDMFV